MILICNIFFLHPTYYPRTTLAPPSSSNSDQGSHSGPSSSLPTSARAFIFTARRIQHFLPSWTRDELYLPTLLGALSSWSLFPFAFLQIKLAIFQLVVVVVVVVVLTLTRIIKSVVTGQAPVTLELSNTLGKNTNNPRWNMHKSKWWESKKC